MYTPIWTVVFGNVKLAHGIFVFAPNKQEFFTILEGLVRIHDQQGGYIEVSAGQAGIIPPSFHGQV